MASDDYPKAKPCQFCGVSLHYYSTPTRGAWYGPNGDTCTEKTTEMGYKVAHMPGWDFETKTWKD